MLFGICREKILVLSHTFLEPLQFLIFSWLTEYKQMFMHNHQKIRLHGLLHPPFFSLRLSPLALAPKKKMGQKETRQSLLLR